MKLVTFFICGRFQTFEFISCSTPTSQFEASHKLGLVALL
jgi:hypothetical protein